MQTCECVLSTDLLDHVPDVQPAAGMYVIVMMLVVTMLQILIHIRIFCKQMSKTLK